METETVIVNGWTQHKVKDFGCVSTGTTPSTKNKDYYGGPYKLISPADLTDSKYIFTAHKYITMEGLKVARTLPKNAILVGCIGNVGKIGITTDEISAFNQQINAIVCNDKFDHDFVYYLLRYQRSALENKAAKVTLPILNKNNFENIVFVVPGLTEQKSISRVLATVQNAIAGQEALIAKLRDLKRSLMQHFFTHGTMREKTKITEIGEIPDSWEIVELGSVCAKPQYGFTDSASDKGNARFLRITDITEDGVDWGKVPFCNCPNPKKYLLIDRDIVFARIGATTGKSYILKNPNNAVYASYLIRVRAVDIQSEYLYYFFQTDAYWKQINSQKGTNLKGGVNGSILSKLLIPKCSEVEQTKIATTFSSIDQRIELTQGKLSVYQNLFKTLLHELMSGERRTRI